MTLKLIPVPVNFIDKAWREGADKLEEVCELSGGEITGSQLKMMLLRGERNLVRMDNSDEIVGWATFCIEVKPNFRVFHICGLHAPEAHFEMFFELVKSYAEAYGCFRMRCSAGPAQARIYKRKLGFKSVYETLEITW